MAWSFYTLAYLDGLRGEYARAYPLIEESLALHKELDNKRGIAFSLIYIAHIHIMSGGNQATAHSLLDESLALFQELDDKHGVAYAVSLRGQLAHRQGDATKARLLTEESLLLYREMGSRAGTAESLYQLGRVTAAQGEETTAYTLYEESLAIAKEMNLKELIASCLEGLAEVVALQDKFVWAVHLWGAAEVLREAVSVPIPFTDRSNYERIVANVCTRLGEQAFAIAWAEGRTMTCEQAIAMQEREMVKPASTAPAIIPSSAYPAGLTTREVEVLRLVVKGLTNAEIAENLGLSEKTIAHHLTHIFNKTTSENRASAAAFAIRHGLA